MIVFHAVWATLSRRPMIDPRFDDLLIRTLGQKARDLRCSLIAGGCASDHVHIVARLAPTTTLADLIGRMKGGSAFDLSRSDEPIRISWQRGYWAASIELPNIDSMVRYVRTQREHHDDSHPAELWQNNAAQQRAQRAQQRDTED